MVHSHGFLPGASLQPRLGREPRRVPHPVRGLERALRYRGHRALGRSGLNVDVRQDQVCRPAARALVLPPASERGDAPYPAHSVLQPAVDVLVPVRHQVSLHQPDHPATRLELVGVSRPPEGPRHAAGAGGARAAGRGLLCIRVGTGSLVQAGARRLRRERSAGPGAQRGGGHDPSRCRSVFPVAHQLAPRVPRQDL